MKKLYLLGALCAGLLSITASPVLASVVYTYTGNQFDTFTSTTTYDTSNFISGFVELENLLAADSTSTPTLAMILDFSFTDGNQTLSMGNGAAIVAMEFTTDANGITNWKIDLNILASAPLNIGDESRFIKTINWDADVQDTGIIQTVTQTIPFLLSTTDQGTVLGSPGSWTGDVASSVVPLPAAAWLFGSGLIGLIAAGRRRKK